MLNIAELINNLAESNAPVRRLRPPMARAALWLAISIPYVAIIALMRHWSGGSPSLPLDARFLIEESAAIATAIAAAIAALCCTIPGRNHRIMFLPLVPLAIWLVSAGEGCINDWLRSGLAGLRLRPDWQCLELAALIGLLPGVAMVVMLRRGAPLFPRATLALGALAVAALANAGLQLVHAGDVTIMILVWHFGMMVIFSALAGWMAPRLLRWPHAAVSRRTDG